MTDWAQVGQSVRERRIVLYGTQAALATAAGVSEKSVRTVEHGEAVSDKLMMRINDALHRAERERNRVTTTSGDQTITKGVPSEYWELTEEQRTAIDLMIITMTKRSQDE